MKIFLYSNGESIFLEFLYIASLVHHIFAFNISVVIIICIGGRSCKIWMGSGSGKLHGWGSCWLWGHRGGLAPTQTIATAYECWLGDHIAQNYRGVS